MSKQPYILQKENGRLVAADQWTYERLDKFKDGDVLKAAKLTKPRSLPFQGFYWVSLDNICKATEIAPTAEHLHKALLKLCKYVTPVMDVHGRVIELVPDSTAFEAMDQAEFYEYVELAKLVMARDLGINWDDYGKREAA